MAISTVMASQQPCKLSKGARPTRKESPQFFRPLSFIIILKKMT